MNINYVVGDATSPEGEGNKLIVHVCNDVRAWGAGFVIALSRKWIAPELAFLSLTDEENHQGKVQFVVVEKDVVVCNMVAQNSVRTMRNNTIPINYYSVAACLYQANQFAIKNGYTIHAPRFGAGLAGGKWEEIENIIKQFVTVDVTIYDLPTK